MFLRSLIVLLVVLNLGIAAWWLLHERPTAGRLQGDGIVGDDEDAPGGGAAGDDEGVMAAALEGQREIGRRERVANHPRLRRAGRRAVRNR